jgi:flagellar hook-basal body complex protein FliE
LDVLQCDVEEAPKRALPRTAAPERIKMTETKTNHPTEFASLFIKGVERAAELQKKSLDDAARQNAEAIAVYKKGPQPVPSAPAVYDLAGQAFEGYIEAQKSVIDQIVKQTASLVESAKDTGDSAQKVAADFTKTVQQSIERAVEVQKKAMDLAAQGSKAPASSKRTA